MKIILALLLSCFTANAALNNPPTSLEKQFLGWRNELKNPGFESGKTGWTVTTTAFNITSTSTEIAEGQKAAEWNPAGIESLRGASWAVATNAGGNAVGFCRVRSNADADYDVEIYDGSNVVGEADVPASTSFILVPVTFIAVGGSTYSIQITSAGDDDEIQVDGCGIGYADGFNIASINLQNEMSVRIDNTAGTPSINSGSEVGGDWVSSVTDNGTGDVTVNFTTGFFNNVPNCQVTGYVGTAHRFCYASRDTAISTSAIRVECASDAGASQDESFFVQCQKTGTDYRTVYTTDQGDFGWTSFTPTGSWVTNTTYTGRYRRVGDTAEIEYGVVVSGAPTAAALTLNMPGSLVIDTSKQVSTVTNRNPWAVGIVGDTGTGNFFGTAFINSSTVIGVKYLDTAAQPVNVTQAAPMTWANTDTLQLTVKVPIVGWQNTNRAPQLVNSVVSSLTGVTRVEWVAFGGATENTNNCTGSPCTIYRQSGGITSVTRSGTGTYAINFTVPFSSPPNCSGHGRSHGLGPAVVQRTGTASGSAYPLLMYRTSSEVVVDTGSTEIICVGPK